MKRVTIGVSAWVMWTIAACGGTVHPAPDSTPPPMNTAEPQPTGGDAVASIPEGYHAITSMIVVRDLPAALAFYERALGAERTEMMPGPDGAPMHGEMRLGDSIVMLAPENEQHGNLSPQAAGGANGALMVYVEDVDAAVARATEAGAAVVMPPADMFWGDRYAIVRDPFGHRWSIAAPIEDLSPRQLRGRAAEWAAGHRQA